MVVTKSDDGSIILESDHEQHYIIVIQASYILQYITNQ